MRRVTCVLVVALLAITIPGVVQAGTFKMKAAHYFDENHAWDKGYQKFRDIIRARSGGALDLEMYNRGVLGSEKDYIQTLLSG